MHPQIHIWHSQSVWRQEWMELRGKSFRHLRDEQEYREQSQKLEETCRLPKSLLEAVEAFEQDELMQSVIGKELSQKYIQTKKREYREYCAQVTAWELEQYLYRI